MRKLSFLLVTVALMTPAQLRLPFILHEPRPAAETSIQVAHGIPFVFLRVNGSAPLPFILDTGSPITYLSKGTMLRLNLSPKEKLSGTLDSAGDRTAEDYNVIRNIRITEGRTEILRGTVEAIDLSALSQMLHIEVAGLLGFDVLKAHPIVLDFPNHRMLMYRTGDYRPRSSEHELDSARCASDPVFDSTIETSRSGNPIPLALMIDTASQEALVLNSPFVKEKFLSDLPNLISTTLAGAVGTFPVQHLDGPLRIWLGDEKSNVDEAFLSQATTGRSARTFPDGYVGLPLFSERALILNCPSGYIAIDGP